MSTPVSISDESSSSSSCFRGVTNNCPTTGICLPGTNATISNNNESPLNSSRMIRRISRPNAASAVEEYEAHLSEGMRHLTFDQIQHEQELLHGVANNNNLPEQNIEEIISSLHKHLNQIKTGTAYERAEKRNSNYASNQELQMAFLRANRFDPKKSAQKIVNFFRYKEELFGDECLVRDITIQDLNEDDLRCLSEGYFQYSPFLDRSGRIIYFEFPGVRSRTLVRTELRARFYFFANSVATMVNLSHGCVFVTYLVGQFQDHLNGAGYNESYAFFDDSIPVDVVGFHVCSDNRLELVVLNAFCAVMPYHMRVKTRVHFGSHTECQYLLASYGITRGALPLTGLNNDMDLRNHRDWYQQRIVQEQKQQHCDDSVKASGFEQKCNDGQIVGRNENDVLCLGRVVKGVGNDRLQSLAGRYFAAYENGSASDRFMIVGVIISGIHSHGGRFLKRDAASAKTESTIPLEDEASNVWKELSCDEERSKVKQLLQNLRRRRSPLSLSTAPSISSSTAGQSYLIPSAAGSSTASPSSTVVDFTQPGDVLFGQYATTNLGNRRLRDLVSGVADEYNLTERGKKKEIVLRLIASIHESGGRFLMARKDKRWEVVSDQIAREKISKQFRNLRRYTSVRYPPPPLND